MAELSHVEVMDQGVRAHYMANGAQVVVGWDYGFRHPNYLAVDQATDIAGVDTFMMRALPMAHAIKILRPWIEQRVMTQALHKLGEPPRRVETDEEYRAIAQAYVTICKHGSSHPVRRLVEWSGVGENTWGARLTRARQRGILVGRGATAVVR